MNNSQSLYIVVFSLNSVEDEVYYCQSIYEVRETVDRLVVSEEGKKKFRVYEAKEVDFGFPSDLGLPDDFEYTEEMYEQDMRAVEELLLKKKLRENEEFLVKKTFFESVLFNAGYVYKRSDIEHMGFDIDELIKEDKIEIYDEGKIKKREEDFWKNNVFYRQGYEEGFQEGYNEIEIAAQHNFTLKDGKTLIYKTDMSAEEIRKIPELANQQDFLHYFYDRGYWLKIFQIIKPNSTEENNE